MLDEITPLIITYNEAPNLRRTLEKLAWARDIVIVDSFSTDETLDIARSFPQARIVQRKFTTFAEQCNFGLEQVRSEWVLSFDADYVLTDELREEVAALAPDESVGGYRARFRYCIQGHPLRASLYPPRAVLYRRGRAKYRDEGHGHRVEIDGHIRELAGYVLHDDRKPLERWLSEQNRYTQREAEHLLTTPVWELNRADRIRRKVVLAPAAVFFYTLIVQGLVSDGLPGWIYVAQRTTAELILSMRLAERKLGIAG
jgi:glycosyltransferase involved in cell wall biosynthesis